MTGFRVETARLCLRAFAPDEAAALCDLVTRPAVGRMLFVFPPDWTVTAAEAFIADWAFDGTARFRLAIAAQDGGRFLGSIGAGGGAEPEVFYFLHPDAAGKGIAREALAGFAAAMFDRFAVPALTATVFQDNPASVRVLEAAGFTRLGESVHASAARLAPASVWHYRLTRHPLQTADRKTDR